MWLKRFLKELQRPQNVKWRKQHKGRVKIRQDLTGRGTFLAHGQFGLQAAEPYRLTLQQLEAARRTIKRGLPKMIKMQMRVTPDIAVTSKAIGTRMGKGKGEVDHFVARVPEHKIIFEIGIDPLIVHASSASSFTIPQSIFDAQEADKKMRRYAKEVTLPQKGIYYPIPTAAQVEPWLPLETAIEALRQGAFKLPIACKIIIREE